MGNGGKSLINSTMASILSAIKGLLTNSTFIACVSSWFSAQFIKTFINILYGKVHSIKQIIESLVWKTGGLPSSHCALVTALTTSIAFKSGIDSDLFILSFCFLMVTVRDAAGVRQSSGLQAQKINQMGRALSEKGILKYEKIKEVMGHKPIEVFLGCGLGFLVALCFVVFSN